MGQHRGSSWEVSRLAKRSFCLKAALSSKPSLASAAMSLPSLVSARGLTCSAASAQHGCRVRGV